MTRYLLRRLPSALLILFLASVLIFLVIRLVPGDPVATLAGPDATPEARAAIRSDLGLDQPVLVQYVQLARAAAARRPRPVVPDRRRHRLAGRPGPGQHRRADADGAAARGGDRHDAERWSRCVADRRWLDALLAGVNTLAVALPTFVTGVLLILVLAVLVPVLPAAGPRRTGS